MIHTLVKGKVVDAANVFYSQKTLGWKIAYERLAHYFRRECDLAGMFVYTATDAGRPAQKKFTAMLAGAGFTVRTKPVKRIRLAGGLYQWKGNFDVELTLDAVGNLNIFDTLILMSGDSDLAPLLDRIKQERKRVLVMSVKGHVAKELLERAKYVNLKKLSRELELLEDA